MKLLNFMKLYIFTKASDDCKNIKLLQKPLFLQKLQIFTKASYFYKDFGFLAKMLGSLCGCNISSAQQAFQPAVLPTVNNGTSIPLCGISQCIQRPPRYAGPQGIRQISPHLDSSAVEINYLRLLRYPQKSIADDLSEIRLQ